MSGTAISVESDRLQAIAVVNGRARSDVFVRLRASNEVLDSDALNPVASKERAMFLGQLPDDFQEEAEHLLSDLAQQVAVERAKSRVEGKHAPEDTFPTVEPWQAAV